MATATANMSTFSPVNTGLTAEQYPSHPAQESTTPTTPRPNTAPNPQPQSLQPSRNDDATTPTKANFGNMASQRPLPASQFPSDILIPKVNDDESKDLRRGGSQHSNASKGSVDVDMDESDDGEDGSDTESINGDGSRSTKKKKSQKFYCTDFPPCNLSFTRSEHLARHIR
jgi:hypothetical protein